MPVRPKPPGRMKDPIQEYLKRRQVLELVSQRIQQMISMNENLLGGRGKRPFPAPGGPTAPRPLPPGIIPRGPAQGVGQLPPWGYEGQAPSAQDWPRMPGFHESAGSPRPGEFSGRGYLGF